MADQDEYRKMLARAIEERKLLDGHIAFLRFRLGEPALSDDPAGGDQPNGQGERVGSPYLGMLAPEAVRQLLRAKRKAMTSREILEGLLEGGFTTTSKNPVNSIRTVLGRLEDQGVVHQADKMRWGLLEWFPAARIRKGRDNASRGPAGLQTAFDEPPEDLDDGEEA